MTTDADNLNFKHFFNLSEQLMCIINPDGVFIAVNHTFEKALGYTSDELLSTPFATFLHPDDLNQTAKELEKLRRGDRSTNFSNRYRHKSGHYLCFRWNSVFDVSNGQIYSIGYENIGLSGLIDDQQHARINHHENSFITRQQMTTGDARLHALGELAGSLAHDLNNPLGVISGYIELINLTEHVSPGLSAKLDSIQTSCEKITDIINNLKRFSRSDKSSSIQNIPLSRLLNNAASRAKPRIKNESVELKLTSDLDFLVTCVEIQIEQIILDLINFTLTAIHPLSNKCLDITTSKAADQISLKISGSGHPQKYPHEESNARVDLNSHPEFTQYLQIIKEVLRKDHTSLSFQSDHTNTSFILTFPI